MDIEVTTISDLTEVLSTPFGDGYLLTEYGDNQTAKLALQKVKEDLLTNTELMGEPTAPKPVDNDDSERLATTSWVQDKVASLGLNPATSSVYGTVRTNTTDSVPVVYLKSEVDALLAPLTSLVSTVNSLIDAAFPAGSLLMSPQFTPPTGFLRCDGSAVSRSTYNRLFGIIGSIFGAGDGTTTFNLPNIGGRVVMGAGVSAVSGTNRSVGTVLGTETHTLSTAEMPAHSHIDRHLGSIGAGTVGYSGNIGGLSSTFPSFPEGGGQPHNNIQPSICFYYHIKF